MSQVHQKGRVTPAMNITPLIDVVFLLIIFFMVVSNIAAEERVDIVIPDLDNPELKPIEEGTRIIINVITKVEKSKRDIDPLNVPGEAEGVKVGAGELIPMSQLGRLTDTLQPEVKKNQDVELLVRADAALYFEDVQRVLKAIAGAGAGGTQLNVRFAAKEED